LRGTVASVDPAVLHNVMIESFDWHAVDLAATHALARHLAGLLFPGAVVALVGPLGAGKTELGRAVAEGLDVADSRIVTSPTFVLIQEYMARLPIYHFDAYRLREVREFFDLGAHEYFQGRGVCLVEWADKVDAALPTEQLRITIAVTGPASRRFTVQGSGADYEELVRRLRQALEASFKLPRAEPRSCE
jgi:tRNA threonylcarbamoyladenosine biosynthesis protein TsaE